MKEALKVPGRCEAKRQAVSSLGSEVSVPDLAQIQILPLNRNVKILKVLLTLFESQCLYLSNWVLVRIK
jgi:hypothetical protein